MHSTKVQTALGTLTQPAALLELLSGLPRCLSVSAASANNGANPPVQKEPGVPPASALFVWELLAESAGDNGPRCTPRLDQPDSPAPFGPISKTLLDRNLYRSTARKCGLVDGVVCRPGRPEPRTRSRNEGGARRGTDAATRSGRGAGQGRTDAQSLQGRGQITAAVVSVNQAIPGISPRVCDGRIYSPAAPAPAQAIQRSAAPVTAGVHIIGAGAPLGRGARA